LSQRTVVSPFRLPGAAYPTRISHRSNSKSARALLNGPALEQDEDVASQDDIDTLFD
jgi:chemotaxis regulatin CheY-phosphate phosphatase CheZ